MPKISILLEIKKKRQDAFESHMTAMSSEEESQKQQTELVSEFKADGLEIITGFAPVPMFSSKKIFKPNGFSAFSSTETNSDQVSNSVVIAAEVDESKLANLQSRPEVEVWPNSNLVFHENRTNFNERSTNILSVSDDTSNFLDRARSNLGIDCRPFEPAATISEIRNLLGVERIWRDGFKGQGIVVGILDEGIDGSVYPVVGGFAKPNAQQPGTASIRSHGSMCAADVLIAAPFSKLYDYPFLGIPNSGGALSMFQAVLNQRRVDGTPHITTNSYGFVGRPPKSLYPNHEVWNIDHPVHRKVREVVASGCTTFFSAGNCGENCPDGRCHVSGIGRGKSIHASNSLEEVITVAAVNRSHDRIGYSSQGPGGFFSDKPDVSCYSHFFANFGPGRPAGGDNGSFDSGTSAATPVAAGVAALLLSAFRDLTTEQVKSYMINGAVDLGQNGWDTDTGHGVVNAAATYSQILRAFS